MAINGLLWLKRTAGDEGADAAEGWVDLVKVLEEEEEGVLGVETDVLLSVAWGLRMSWGNLEKAMVDGGGSVGI